MGGAMLREKPAIVRRLLVETAITLGFAALIVVYGAKFDTPVGDGGTLRFEYSGAALVFPLALTVCVACRLVLPWGTFSAQLLVEWVMRALDVSAEPFGVALALFTLATVRGIRSLVVGVVVAVTVLVLSVFFAHRTLTGFTISLVVYALGAALGCMAVVAERRQTALLRLLAVARRDHARRVRRAERVELAGEVHDVLSGVVAVTMRLAEVGRDATEARPDLQRAALERIVAVSRAGMTEVRRAVRVLDDGAPTAWSVGAVVEDMRSAGLPIVFTERGTPIDGATGTAVTRVVHESLTNVLKHARPTAVDVQLTWPTADRPGAVSVANDGVLTGTRRTPGHGVAGMRRRIAGIGGRCTAGLDAADGRWTVRAVLPATDAQEVGSSHRDVRPATSNGRWNSARNDIGARRRRPGPRAGRDGDGARCG